MALATITDAELLARCTEVFRTYGFEGATMSRISAATGLEKGSLYHRFPGGKKEMALAVAAGVVEWFKTNVFDVLKQAGPPQKRLRAAAEQLRSFYAEGTSLVSSTCSRSLPAGLSWPVVLRAPCRRGRKLSPKSRKNLDTARVKRDAGPKTPSCGLKARWC